MLPLAFHEDGTTVIGIGKTWSRQFTVIFSFGTLGKGRTRDMQLHICSFFDECSGPNTGWVFRHFEVVFCSTTEMEVAWDTSFGAKIPDSNKGKLAGTLLAEGFALFLGPLRRLRVHEFGAEAPSLCEQNKPLWFVSLVWWKRRKFLEGLQVVS